MNKTDNILVGKIVAFQGIRGDVRIQTYTEKPSDFCNLNIISSKFASDDFKFIRCVPNSNVIIAHIRGFEDRTSAEILRGTELFINRNTLPALAPGEYYQTDLIGMNVIRDGKVIGIVSGFQNFGAGDIIETNNGDMFAFRAATVNPTTNTITVK